MMPMTPSGTRTRWNLRPLGRVHSASTVPTGSVSAATSSSALRHASMRFSSSSRRSTNATGAAGFAGCGHVFCVGGEDGRRGARGSPWRRGCQRGVLGVGRRQGEATSGDPGLAADLQHQSLVSIAMRSGAFIVRASWLLPVSRSAGKGISSAPAQRHVVAMDQFVAAAEAEDRRDLAELLPMMRGRRPRGRRRARGQPRGLPDHGSQRHRRARRRLPRGVTPAGSRLLPVVSALSAPASTSTVPFGSSWPAIQRLRAVTGSEGAMNHVHGRAVGDRPQRVLSTLPEVMTMCGPGGHRDLAGLDLGAHAALGQLGAGVAGHGFDLGRDLGYMVDALGIGVGIRAARCRGRRCRTTERGNRRKPSRRRGRTGGRCRRSGSRQSPQCRFR